MASASIKGHMDLRCLDPPYHEDLLDAIDETVTSNREVFTEATHQLERFERAHKKGKDKLNGDDVEVSIGVYREVVNEIPISTSHLEQMYKVVLKAPSCTDLMFVERTVKSIKFDARGRKKYPSGLTITRPRKPRN